VAVKTMRGNKSERNGHFSIGNSAAIDHGEHGFEVSSEVALRVSSDIDWSRFKDIPGDAAF
jgi:hypothetical protein